MNNDRLDTKLLEAQLLIAHQKLELRKLNKAVDRRNKRIKGLLRDAETLKLTIDPTVIPTFNLRSNCHPECGRWGNQHHPQCVCSDSDPQEQSLNML